MIDQDFQNFFLAIAGASAALIGLLFVAISVAPGKVVGPKALALHELRANMALISFASALVLSLIALMPQAHIGWPATIIGAGGSLFGLHALRDLHSRRDHSRSAALILLVLFLFLMVFLTVSGIRSLLAPHETDPVSDAGIATIGLLVLGIDRAWELVGGRRTGIITGRLLGGSRTPAPGDAEDDHG